MVENWTNMIKIKFLIVVFTLLWGNSCLSSNSTTSNTNLTENNKNMSTSSDYKNLILGKWEGKSDKPTIEGWMLIEFRKDGLAVIEYSPPGGKFTRAYKFKNEKTLEVEGYPDNLIINKNSDDEITFNPEIDKERDIDVIYVYSFKRMKP